MTARTSAHETTLSIQLPVPYDARSLLGFLSPRTVAGIESLDGATYLRSVRLPGGPATMRLEVGVESVEVQLKLSEPADFDAAVRRCSWLLDLETDVVAAEAYLARDPRLAEAISAHPGLRVPGQVDGFEVAVRAVVGQQISVAGARTIVGRLVGTYGDALPADLVAGTPALTSLFPSAAVIAGVDPETLPMPRSRGRALVAIAEAVAMGDVVLERGVGLAEIRRGLLALPGIGPWTADYIALRALGDPDVFMMGDLGVRHGLARMGFDPADAAVARTWSPWRSYAQMHVWKQLDRQPA